MAALAALVCVSGALAAFPGANGRIVASRYDGVQQLVTMNPDGSDQQVVPTPGIETPVHPKWSPDGQTIAFSDNSSSLYTIAPDGSGLTLVASDASNHAWAPDGDHLTFTTPGELVNLDLANGTRDVLLTLPTYLDNGDTVSGSRGIAWSPDGARLALDGRTWPTGYNGDLFLLDVASGTPTALTRSPLFPDTYTGGNSGPDWSPSGNSLVFTCAVWKYTGDICRIGADGTGLEIFTESLPPVPPGDGSDYRSPIVAPDGAAIINTLSDDAGLQTIERRNADGGSPVNIVAPAPGVYWRDLDWQALPLPPTADADGDGVVDAIDSGPGQWSDPVAGNPATTGSIVSAGGLAVLVEDAADPDGVRITTGPGAGPATVSVCGIATMSLPANAEVIVTCGSVTVEVLQGPIVLDLGGGLASVTVPTGATAKVSESAGGTFSVQSLAGGALTVTV